MSILSYLILGVLLLSSSSLLNGCAQQVDGYHGPTSTPLEVPREGAISGNELGTDIFFAGGVNLLSPSPSSFTVFTDIFFFNLTDSTYIDCISHLLSPSYFGTGGYDESHHTLMLYSGRTNSDNNGILNTYYSHLQKVDFSSFFAGGSILSPSVRPLNLSPVPTPRQFASSIQLGNLLYVFGGMTGNTGRTACSDVFFSIDLTTGFVTSLSMLNVPSPFNPSPASYVATARINPAMFTSPTLGFIYFYSGLLTDYFTYANTANIYIYNISADGWIPPTAAALPRNEFNLAMPNLVFSSSVTAGHYFYMYVSGSSGILGTQAQLVLIDTQNLLSSPSTGVVYMNEFRQDTNQSLSNFFGIQPSAFFREKSVTGWRFHIDDIGISWTLWWYGGAVYDHSSDITPVSYSVNTTILSVSFAWADFNLTSPLGQAFTPPATPASSSCSDHTGAIVGGVVGGIGGIVLLTLLVISCYLFRDKVFMSGKSETMISGQKTSSDTEMNAA